MNYHSTLLRNRPTTVLMEILVVAAVIFLGFVIGGAGLAIPLGAGVAVAVFSAGKTTRCHRPHKRENRASD